MSIACTKSVHRNGSRCRPDHSFRIATRNVRCGTEEVADLLSQEQLGRVNENEAAKKQIEKAIRITEEEKDKLTEEEVDKLVEAVLDEQRFTLTGLTYLRDLSKNGDDSGRQGSGMESGLHRTSAWATEVRRFRLQSSRRSTRCTLSFWDWCSVSLGRFMANRGIEPSTPVKFSLGLVQLGLGFGVFWWGSHALPTATAWSPSAGCSSATCFTPPVNCASRPSAWA